LLLESIRSVPTARLGMSSTPKLQPQAVQLGLGAGSASTPTVPLGAAFPRQLPGVLQLLLDDAPLQVAVVVLVAATAPVGANSAAAATMVAANAAARSIFKHLTSSS
jgi:hypothetical protein